MTAIPAGMVVCRSFHDLLEAGVFGCCQLHVRQGQQLLQVDGLGKGQTAFHSLLQPPVPQLGTQHRHHGGLVGQQIVVAHLGACTKGPCCSRDSQSAGKAPMEVLGHHPGALENMTQTISAGSDDPSGFATLILLLDGRTGTMPDW